MTTTMTAAERIQAIIDASAPLRAALRRRAGLQRYDSRPIEVVDGATWIRMAGEGWHYETRTGIRIYSPSAYAKKGWSSMIYTRSDRRVEVGTEYLARHFGIGIPQIRSMRVRMAGLD